MIRGRLLPAFIHGQNAFPHNFTNIYVIKTSSDGISLSLFERLNLNL